jgi:hypothetical protein
LVRKQVLYGFAFEEAGLFGKRVEHLCAGVVGGCIADLVAVWYCYGHASISNYNLKNTVDLICYIPPLNNLKYILLYMQQPAHDLFFIRHG